MNERRRQSAVPFRDVKYLSERVRIVEVIEPSAASGTVAFGSVVTFSRDDGRKQTYRIVGEDEADPKAGSISYVSPVARALMGKVVSDVVIANGQQLEVLTVAQLSSDI